MPSYASDRLERPAPPSLSGGDRTTVQALSEIKQIAENARQGLLAERTMGDAERQAGLKAIQEETQRAIRQNLGEKLYPAYARNAGNWMDALGAAAVSP